MKYFDDFLVPAKECFLNNETLSIKFTILDNFEYDNDFWCFYTLRTQLELGHQIIFWLSG